MQVSDESFQKHSVFADLERLISFYDRLADSVFLMPTPGTKAICNIDSYVYSSIQGTLVSIERILRDGRINDAYALLRKYYDSTIINIYSNLFLDDHFAIENLVVKQIDDWLKGKTQIPEFRVMNQYIRSSAKVSKVTSVLHVDSRYRQLRKRCNEHTHYNFYRNVLLNDNEIHLAERGPALNEFSQDLRDVAILHMAYLFDLRQHYMMSSDYVDSLECGMTPEPDSQYWVAPFIQEAFDHFLVQNRPDVAATIKSETAMQLT